MDDDVEAQTNIGIGDYMEVFAKGEVESIIEDTFPTTKIINFRDEQAVREVPAFQQMLRVALCEDDVVRCVYWHRVARGALTQVAAKRAFEVASMWTRDRQDIETAKAMERKLAQLKQHIAA